MQSTSMLLSLTTGAMTLLFVALDVAFLVIVMTTVRRQRPDAWGLLAIAVGVGIVTTILGVVSGFVGSIFVTSSGGIDAFMRYQIASHLLLGMIGVVARVVFIVGVMRLARDPNAPQGEMQPY